MNLFPIFSNLFPKLFAFGKVFTFAPLPYGMSIRMCFAPAAIFFDIIDARSCGSTSRFNRRSTWMILSSDGANPNEPPHARQAPVFLTTCFIFFIGSSTFDIVSITSAVPDAEVIALEDVFGRVSPTAAQIAMTIGVVRFPAIPPMQCLSARYLPLNFSLTPVFTIAFVSPITSSKSIPFSFSAAVKKAISASVKLFWTISDIRKFNSSLVNFSPFNFFLIRADASEISDELTSTSDLFFAFRILLSSSDSPISFFLISFGKMSTTA